MRPLESSCPFRNVLQCAGIVDVRSWPEPDDSSFRIARSAGIGLRSIGELAGPYLNISNKSLSSCRCSNVERKQKLTPLRMATVWNPTSSSFVIGCSTGSKCRSAHALRSENPDVSFEKSSFSLGRMVEKSLTGPARLPRAWHWRRMVLLSPPTKRASDEVILVHLNVEQLPPKYLHSPHRPQKSPALQISDCSCTGKHE